MSMYRLDSLNSGIYNMTDMLNEMQEQMFKNMARYLGKNKEFDPDIWHIKSMQSMANFKIDNSKIITGTKKDYQEKLTNLLQHAAELGMNITDKDSKKMLGESNYDKNALKSANEFFSVNHHVLNTLFQDAITDNTQMWNNALRYSEDIFRQVIFKTGTLMKGAGLTLPKAIDKATSTFLDNGIQSIQYKNGANVNIASYSEMALRTQSQRVAFHSAGLRREEYGTRLVMIDSIGSSCGLCAPWQGRVYIDDTYQMSGPAHAGYPMLSEAYSGGFGHSNCRHDVYTYYEGINEPPAPPTTQEVEDSKNNYNAEQKQRALERNVRKWKRRSIGAIAPESKTFADGKIKEWQGQIRQHLKENPFLRRDYGREKIFTMPKSDLVIDLKPNKVLNFKSQTEAEKYFNKSIEQQKQVEPKAQIKPLVEIKPVENEVVIDSDVQAKLNLSHQKPGQYLNDKLTKFENDINEFAAGNSDVPLITKKMFDGGSIENVSKSDADLSKQFIKALQSAPETNTELYRVEEIASYNKNLKVGDDFTMGIRSFTKSESYIKKIVSGEDVDSGIENPIVYEVVGASKSLNIEGYSMFDEQHESITGGKFKVVNVIKSKTHDTIQIQQTSTEVGNNIVKPAKIIDIVPEKPFNYSELSIAEKYDVMLGIKKPTNITTGELVKQVYEHAIYSMPKSMQDFNSIYVTDTEFKNFIDKSYPDKTPFEVGSQLSGTSPDTMKHDLLFGYDSYSHAKDMFANFNDNIAPFKIDPVEALQLVNQFKLDYWDGVSLKFKDSIVQDFIKITGLPENTNGYNIEQIIAGNKTVAGVIKQKATAAAKIKEPTKTKHVIEEIEIEPPFPFEDLNAFQKAVTDGNTNAEIGLALKGTSLNTAVQGYYDVYLKKLGYPPNAYNKSSMILANNYVVSFTKIGDMYTAIQDGTFNEKYVPKAKEAKVYDKPFPYDDLSKMQDAISSGKFDFPEKLNGVSFESAVKGWYDAHKTYNTTEPALYSLYSDAIVNHYGKTNNDIQKIFNSIKKGTLDIQYGEKIVINNLTSSMIDNIVNKKNIVKFQDRDAADAYFRPLIVKQWKTLTQGEKDAAYQYTYGPGKFNRPLRKLDYYGKEDLSVDINSEGAEQYIVDLYNAINKCTIKEDVKIRRGDKLEGLQGILKDADVSIVGMDITTTEGIKQINQKLAGHAIYDEGFLSTGIADNAGWQMGGNIVVDYDIFVPKGTKGIYVEPFSNYGGTNTKGDWDGTGGHIRHIGGEAEIVLQAGTKYILNSIKLSGGTYKVSLTAIPQHVDAHAGTVKSILNSSYK